MKKCYSFIFLCFFSLSAASGQTIAWWNFDASDLIPSIGPGTFTALGTTTAFVQGNPITGMGLNTSSYPTQGTGSGTEGIQVNVNSTFFTGIVLGFDIRLSNTASKFYQVQYTTNGSTWNVFDLTALTTINSTGGVDIVNDVISIPLGTAWYTYYIHMGGLTSIENNPNFGIRIISVFDPAGGTSYTGVAGGYLTTGTTRFDNVAIGVNNTLPIKLSFFTAKITKEKKVLLSWETKTETNFKHFIIERSSDGIAFTSINTILAVGNSGNSYQYTDATASGKQVFYRLKIVNFDNSFEYSNIARVDLKGAANSEFTIAPNPVSDALNLEFAKMGEGTIYVYDLFGNVVIKERTTGSEITKNIDMSLFASGIYVLSFHTGDSKTTQSFFKQ